MKSYTLTLTLLSPALAGAGEGFGAIVDSDIVFDEAGVPFIPAKRIKGCLLDSACEIRKIFEAAGIDYALPIEETFGRQGSESSAPVYFSNLMIEDYETVKAWLDFFLDDRRYKSVLSGDAILGTFTEIRRQTRIDKKYGTAAEGSLRTSRIIQKARVFTGEVIIETPDAIIPETIAMACANFRRFGTARNRGFGEIRCVLSEDGREISITKRLEELCAG